MNMKDPCDFSIQEEYLTIPKVKPGESLKEKAIEHFGPSGIDKINKPEPITGPSWIKETRMCGGCKNFLPKEHGVGTCQRKGIEVLEREYANRFTFSTCFE